jgi:translation initiation factor IF-3
MEISGKIRLINPLQQVSATFKKRELVVTTEEQYPQNILVEFVQDKTDLLNTFQPGEDVKVSINLRGREWTSPQGELKFFNSIVGWRIEKMGTAMGQPPVVQNVSTPSINDGFEPATNFNEEEHDDLPF